MQQLLAFACASALVSGCASKKPLPVAHQVMDTLRISAADPINFYRETRPLFWDIVHTDLSLSFHFKEKTADGVALIKMHPYAYPQQQVVLNAKSMTIHEVSERPIGTVKYDYVNDSLIIHCSKTYQPADTLYLQIKYTAKPYEAIVGGSRAISQDRGLYFINTDGRHPFKPMQLWTQGETEANAHWMPTNDQPNERFTASIALTVPDTMTTLSNGFKKSSKPLGQGLRQDLWVMDQPIQPYAFMFAIGKFSIVPDKQGQGKPVDYYVEPAYAPYAQAMFRHTPEMMDYFSQVTGVPYPWNKYSQVVVRDYVSGAMENTSASLFGEFINLNFRQLQDRNQEDVVSHELFHQWFGDYVTAESWSHLTVNESFATYGEQLWRRFKYGQDACDELAISDLERYIGSTRNDDPPLLRFYYNSHEDMFDRVSYQKGGMILRYMHGLMGDEVFTRAMKTYLTRNALQPAEASDWRKAVEAATGKDWAPFFTQWYARGGHPQLEVSYSYNDTAQLLTVTTRQKQPDSAFAYKLALKALLLHGGAQEEVDWLIEKRLSTATFPYRNGKRPVFVPDSRYWLVGTLKDQKKTEQWLAQLELSAAGSLALQYRALNALATAGSDSLYRIGLSTALQSKHALIRKEAAEALQRKSGKYWETTLRDQLFYIAENDPKTMVRAEAIRTLAKWKTSGLKELAEKAIGDSSYAVAGAALRALHRVDSLAAVQAARQLAPGSPKSELYDAIWFVLSNQGDYADYPLLVAEAERSFSRRAGWVADDVRGRLKSDSRRPFDFEGFWVVFCFNKKNVWYDKGFLPFVTLPVAAFHHALIPLPSSEGCGPEK